MRLSFAACATLALAFPACASAHGLGGGVGESPIPDWLKYFGSAAVLVLSFSLLGALWSRAVLRDAAAGRALPAALSEILLAPFLAWVLRVVSVALLGLVWIAAAFGDESPARNLAPTFVYVVFWLGLPVLSVLFGDVWSVLNPWKAVFPGDDGPREYPRWLGYYPAALGLFAFATLELAYFDSASPRALALAIAIYSGWTWTGAAVFGRRAWFRYGDAFSVYFRLLAAMAPFARRGRRVVLRAPMSGLADAEAAPGLLGFIAVALGSVAFDGFSRTPTWQGRLYDVRSAFLPDRLALADLMTTLLNLGCLLLFVWVVALIFIAALEVARRMGHGGRALDDAILPSLVPIAFVYVVAHYFALFVYQGQETFRLVSDPLGRGWDLVGTADFRSNLTVFSTDTIWYVQVAALVAGHVCGLVVAHDRALAALPTVRDALRSQYAVLALMVFYTAGGLWLLSQG